MSGNPTIIPAIQLRAYEKQMESQILLGSIFEQFSSRVKATEAIQNDGKPSVPNAVINSQTDKFQKGVMYTTIPTMDKLKKRGPSGSGRAQGTEEVVKLRYARCYYNMHRKALTFGDESVDGDAVAAYPIASEQTRLLGDYFAEVNDYAKHRAVILGADEDLTLSTSWTDSSVFGGAPVTEMMHPRTYILGQSTTAPVTWNATFATHITSVLTAFHAANSSANATFTKVKLDKIIALANRTLLPLSYKSGGMAIKFLIVLSQVQADQLQADTATGGWWGTMTEAGARGNDNRSISGLLGAYRECMLLVDVRAPLMNVAGTGAYSSTALARFQFVKAWADDSSKAEDIDAGDNRVPTTYAYSATPLTNATGTAEICMVLGSGAILESIPKKLAFHSDTQDYDFSKGAEARKASGNMRADFTGEALTPGGWSSATVAPNNFSSFIVLSPTAAGSL